MTWVWFVAGGGVLGGVFWAPRQRGQVGRGQPLRGPVCGGAAYFLIGVLVPVIALSAQGELRGFSTRGVVAATLGGTLGALGAVCIIWAFRSGGTALYVMPLGLAGGPVI